MISVEIKRKDDAFAFEGIDANGHTLRMDAAAEIGGNNSGVRPMQVLLMSLGGCSGIDIVSILKKQRQDVKDFSISIHGEREQGKEPSLWKKIDVLFKFKGTVDEDKARKACALSIDKYCSVAATLRAAGCEISWDILIEN
ncbi:MAG: OsmC family protein [Sphingobacteriia bacterium]|nr:OsmC family protein [Sphingobacteriia bacterium]